MILIDKVEIVGLEPAIRGMRNPLNSWDKSDSGICKGGDNGIGCSNCALGVDRCDRSYDHTFQIGVKDYCLMRKLANGGPVHAKYRRMITVYLDVTAPLYWWKEFDTYKVGTVANSCSTMHTIHEKEFTLDDFSHEHLFDSSLGEDTDCWIEESEDSDKILEPCNVLETIIQMLNKARTLYLEYKEKGNQFAKEYWWQMIQLLPSSYNQKRTIMLNYEVLAGIYLMRKNHKLDEWQAFCNWIESLPCSEIITCKMLTEAEMLMSLVDEGKTPNQIREIFGFPTIKKRTD